jgi:RNA polymerase sigma factor (sigma-70 family)
MTTYSRDQLIEANIGLVGQVIKDRIHNINGIGFYTYDDLFQIGCIGLCKAADRYRPGKASFSTYAYVFIRNEIFGALEYATLRRTHETAADPDELPHSTAPELPDTMLDLMLALDKAQSEASGITEKGIKAIRLLADGYTCREIGERMGKSANNVSAWVSRARNYLRTRPEIAALKEVL